VYCYSPMATIAKVLKRQRLKLDYLYIKLTILKGYNKMKNTDCVKVCVTVNGCTNDSCCDGGGDDGSGDNGGTVTNILGKIELMPFSVAALPIGWYFCNNDRYAKTTAQGVALLALSDEYKTQWNITEVEEAVNVPDLFSDDGRGMFLRAVDGNTRQVGSVEDDAIRNIEAKFYTVQWGVGNTSTGAFYEIGGRGSAWNGPQASSTYHFSTLGFSASRDVPTASESRPLNIGMTPAIFLGV